MKAGCRRRRKAGSENVSETHTTDASEEKLETHGESASDYMGETHILTASEKKLETQGNIASDYEIETQY